MTFEADMQLLGERDCSNVKGISNGTASLAQGYNRTLKKRMFIMRADDAEVKFHLPARASSHAKREALWQAQTSLCQAKPECALDLFALLKEADVGAPVS